MAESAHTSEPRTRDAAATRSDLLRAAMRRFTLLGYERTTTRDIAADAGANVSLISRYFGSKEGLFGAVVQESAEALKHLEPASPGRDLIDELMTGLEPGAWAEFGGEHPLTLLSGDTGDGDEVRTLRQQALRAVVGLFARQLEPRGAGHTDPIEAELLLAFLTGLTTIRSALPDGLLATADPATLRRILQRLIDTRFIEPTADQSPPHLPAAATDG